MRDFKVVTVSTGKPAQEYYTYDQFFKSLGEIEPIILEARQGVNWSGLGSKPKILYKAIKDGLINSKYILFCDCYDLVFARNPADIINDYLDYDMPLVISAEKNCFPDDLKKEYDSLPYTTSYKYLNSGMIVGETEALLSLLESMDLKNVPEDYWDGQKMVHINDQFLYQQIFLNQQKLIALDYEQILCNTLHSVHLSELDFSRKKILNIETGFYPGSFHLNGSAKTDGLRQPILNHLEL